MAYVDWIYDHPPEMWAALTGLSLDEESRLVTAPIYLSARAEALARAEEEHAAALRAAAAGGSDEARGLAELRALMAEGNARRARARGGEGAFLAGYLAPNRRGDR